jgi:hypothetical protein
MVSIDALKDLIPTYDLANGLTCDSLMSSPSRLAGISKLSKYRRKSII